MKASTGARVRASAVCLLLAALLPGQARAQQVRINRLTDLDFGVLAANGASEAVLADSLCIYTGSGSLGYRVTARGSGSGNSFALMNGGNALPYVAEWAAAPNATSGAQMSPNAPISANTTGLLNLQCLFGVGANATLIVRLPAADVAGVTAGTYTGTITVMIEPN